MSLTLADIPAASAVFVDANVFVYHFAPHPVLQATCQQLLERFATEELIGYTSAHVVSNVAHRIMTLEAMDRFGWPIAGVGRRLQAHPEEIRQLTRFRQAVEEIPGIGIRVAPVSWEHVSTAGTLSQQFGLLSGDALVVAVMRAQGLAHLASHDADFDRVPGLVRYAPA